MTKPKKPAKPKAPKVEKPTPPVGDTISRIPVSDSTSDAIVFYVEDDDVLYDHGMCGLGDQGDLKINVFFEFSVEFNVDLHSIHITPYYTDDGTFASLCGRKKPTDAQLKEYETALAKYQEKMDAYQKKLEEWEVKVEEWKKANGGK